MGSQAPALVLHYRPPRRPLLPPSQKKNAQRHTENHAFTLTKKKRKRKVGTCQFSRSDYPDKFGGQVRANVVVIGRWTQKTPYNLSPSSFTPCWETLQSGSLTVTLVLAAQPPPSPLFLPITDRWPVPHSKVICLAQQ